MKLLIATSNPHKLDEIRAVFDALRTPGCEAIDIFGLDRLNQAIPEPDEDQPTFEGNAVLKACYYARESGEVCLADDSGLEVDALGGEPGVRSARYAGVSGARSVVDPANNALLLERLRGVAAEKRSARFVCAMAVCSPASGEPIALVRGTVEGRILGPIGIDARGRGGNGFGYDPLFFVPRLGKTTAELAPHEKNAISHRGAACRLIWPKLQALVASH